MISAIGPFEFRSLTVPGMPVERSLTVVAHAGIDGVEIWDDGERGMPFQVRSEAVYLSVAQAYEQFTLYKKLKGEPPVLVLWANLFAEATKHKVLDVRLPEGGVRPIVAGFGPGGVPFSALLTAEWTLLPIKIETEEEEE